MCKRSLEFERARLTCGHGSRDRPLPSDAWGRGRERASGTEEEGTPMVAAPQPLTEVGGAIYGRRHS